MFFFHKIENSRAHAKTNRSYGFACFFLFRFQAVYTQQIDTIIRCYSFSFVFNQNFYNDFYIFINAPKFLFSLFQINFGHAFGVRYVCM